MSGKSFSVNNAAAASKTFTPTVPLKDGVQYVDSSVALSAPRMAVVKHTLGSSTQSNAIDRHYVQFTKTVYDAVGKAYQASVGISLVIPRTNVTAADIDDLVAFAKNLLGDTTIMGGLKVGDY